MQKLTVLVALACLLSGVLAVVQESESVKEGMSNALRRGLQNFGSIKKFKSRSSPETNVQSPIEPVPATTEKQDIDEPKEDHSDKPSYDYEATKPVVDVPVQEFDTQAPVHTEPSFAEEPFDSAEQHAYTDYTSELVDIPVSF